MSNQPPESDQCNKFSPERFYRHQILYILEQFPSTKVLCVQTCSFRLSCSAFITKHLRWASGVLRLDRLIKWNAFSENYVVTNLEGGIRPKTLQSPSRSFKLLLFGISHVSNLIWEMTACEMQDLNWTVTNLLLCRICDWNSERFDSGSTFDSDNVAFHMWHILCINYRNYFSHWITSCLATGNNYN